MRDLKIIRGGTEYIYSYEELQANHKGGMVAGVALAYRIIEYYLREEVKNEKIYFFTGIGINGKGILDTARLVFGDDVTIDTDIAKTKDITKAALAPNGGRYFFVIEDSKRKLEFFIKEGLVPEAFIKYNKLAMGYEDETTMPKDILENLIKVRNDLKNALEKVKFEDIITVRVNTL